MVKLPMPPIFKAKCDTKGNDAFFQGDIGSIYIVDCPPGYLYNFSCLDAPVNVFGSGIYTIDSSVCRAAIHVGVTEDKGGIVEYTLREGLTSYEASVNRGISSMSQAS